MRGKSEEKIRTNTKPSTNFGDVRQEVVAGLERGDFGGSGVGKSSDVKKKKGKKENNSTAAKENFRQKNFGTSKKNYAKTSKSNASQPRSGLVDFRFDKEAKGQRSNEVGTALFKVIGKASATVLSKDEPSKKEEEKSLQKVGEEGKESAAAPVLLGTDKEVEHYYHSRAEHLAQSQEVGESVVPKSKTASEHNLCQLSKKPVNNRNQSLNNILAPNTSSDAEKTKNSFGCLLSIRRLVEEKSQNLSFSNTTKNQTLPIKSLSVEAGNTSPEKEKTPSGSFKSFKKKGRRTSFSSERVVEEPELTGSSRTPSTVPEPPTPSKSLPKVRDFGLRKTLSTFPQPTVTWDGREEPFSSRSGIPRPTNGEKPAPDDAKSPADEDSPKRSHAPEKKEGDGSESPRCSRTKGNNKKICIYNCAATDDFNQKFLKSIYLPTTGAKAGKKQKRLRNADTAPNISKFSPRSSATGKQNKQPTGGKVFKNFKATTKPAAKSDAITSTRTQKKKIPAPATSGNRDAKKPAKEDKGGIGVWQYQEEKSAKSPGQAASGLPPVFQAKSPTKEDGATSNFQVKSNQKTKTKVMKELEVLEKLFSKLKSLQSSMEKQSALDQKKELLKSVEKTYQSSLKLTTPEKKPDAATHENDVVLKQRKSIRTAIIHHVRNWLKLEFAYH